MTAENFNSRLTDYDPGSGVYRREVVFRKLDELFQQDPAQNPVVMLIEMHRFKQINDGTSPLVGDRVISSFARRLQRTTSSDAMVGRMGGDGFAIVLPSDNELDAVVERVLEITRRPFSVGGNVIVVSVSIGIAIGGDHGSDATKLIHAADIALHSILDDQHEDYVIFSEEMMATAQSVHLLENDFRYSVVLEKPALLEAVASNQFEVFYQPLVDARSRLPVGVEALLRWHHPERGYVDPESFIPLAEEIGVINLLGAWVLQTACRDLQVIRESTSFGNLTLDVNVSPRQLDDVSLLLKQVSQAVADTGFPAEDLVLEITESTVLECDQYEIERVLKKKCSLALDDFGTGYSSMNILRGFPVKMAKLDKLFVSNLFREDNEMQVKDEQMTRAFQSMCQALDIETTIEGVETAAQADYLTELGCNILQGFYFSEPQPLTNLIQYLNQFERGEHEPQAVSH